MNLSLRRRSLIIYGKNKKNERLAEGLLHFWKKSKENRVVVKYDGKNGQEKLTASILVIRLLDGICVQMLM